MSSSFKPEYKIRHQAEFNAVFKAGKTHFSPYIVLKQLKSKERNARLGVIIRKKHVQQATVRNAIKRQIKEVFRQHAIKNTGYDLVCVVRYTAQQASSHEIRECVQRLFEKLLSSSS